MTLLVTGATGHVGGEIVRQAAQRGMRVIATHRGELRADEANPSVSWVRCDLADAGAVRRLAEEHRIGAKCRDTAEDGPDVVGVRDAFEHDDGVGPAQQLTDWNRGRSFRERQTALVNVEARNNRKIRPIAHIDGDVRRKRLVATLSLARRTRRRRRRPLRSIRVPLLH